MRFWDMVMRGCGGFSAALIAAMTLLVAYDVVARNIGLGSLPWVLEISEYMLPTLICASAPWLMYRGAHIRLDLLRMLTGPALNRAMEVVVAVVATVAAALFTWFALELLLTSRAAGNIVMKALIFPEWWIYIPVPIGFALLTLECARQIFMAPDMREGLAG